MDDKSSSYNGAKTDFREDVINGQKLECDTLAAEHEFCFSLFGVFPRRRHVLPFFLGPLNILWPHVSSK
jgi:hypothetical protein